MQANSSTSNPLLYTTEEVFEKVGPERKIKEKDKIKVSIKIFFI